jgi:conserved oligomeric Golgi complex subunit 6
MNSTYLEDGIEAPQDGTAIPASSLGTAASSGKAGALSGKITTLLSSSFADSDIRDALAILDARGVRNNAETRRTLRQDAQKEVIDCNAEIVADFGKVAEV